MLVRIRRVLAQTARAARALATGVQLPRLHVAAVTLRLLLIRLTTSRWIFRLHSVTPYSRLPGEASVEGGVEDTTCFINVVSVFALVSG
jgi:hypothetical protein